MAGKPHLLYVAWGFPPARTGGVHRALATANRFVERGWQVTVLTAERAVFERHTGSDPGLEGAVDPRVSVIRVPFRWPAKETDLARWSTARVLAPRLWWRWRKYLDTRHFPEPAYGPWAGPLGDAAEAVHRRTPVDLVVATLNPYVDAVAGQRLAQRHQVPYVLDYRDAWSLDMFSGRTVHEASSRVGLVEARLIEGAAQVWFVNEAIAAWHTTRHPAAAARVRVVPNGYDAPSTFAPKLRRSAPVFGYLGTLTHHVPVRELLEAWRLARADGRLPSDARLHLHGFLGYYRGSDDSLARLVSGSEHQGVHYHGPVAKGDVQSVYAGCDVLVLAMGSGRYITSGKTYEYAATGLPIVAVHERSNATTATLAEYPLIAGPSGLDPADIAADLGAAAELAATVSAADIASARAWATRFDRRHVLDPRIEELTP